ncbi:MAG: phosphoenolpyruvate synthase regulatory protein [Micavibrio sp.]|nr:phosphoenolpyruvate synthase regulatory protein [Micavibrio sp.]|tara:strand:+ start:3241 stop:4083 length:843 start_codon:yes stop_codon:yes gene_type:complete
MEQKFYIHLVSDSTGTTLHGLARACLAQFEDVHPVEKFWNMIRNEKQLDIVLKSIEDMQGIVIYTLVDKDLRKRLTQFCRNLKVPCIAVLDPLIKGLSHHLNQEPKGMPGLQHQLNDQYFDRIEAVDFALHHDDGKVLHGLEEADVVLVGVSRTSKTPTCMYLANRGVRAANIPLVPSVTYPTETFTVEGPLYIGLTENPKRLAEIRTNRLKDETGQLDMLAKDNAYLDEEAISEEIRTARKLFSKYNWPVIDVTRRSVEETAGEIITLLMRHKPEMEIA